MTNIGCSIRIIGADTGNLSMLYPVMNSSTIAYFNSFSNSRAYLSLS